MAFKTIRDLPAIPAVEHNLEITSDDFLMISNKIEGGSTYKISVTQLNDVLPVFTPATSTTIGIKGLVPAPQEGELDEYLTSSGDWDIIPINERIKSGIVTAPETETSVKRRTYINALKSWSTNADGEPGWRSWVDTIDVFVGPTATVDGKKGLVPAPGAGEGQEILRADGQWVLARDMVSSVTVSATAPTDPVPKNGDLWFDTDSGSLFVYVEIASSWIEVSGGSGASASDIPLVTQTSDGLMRSSDKLKLDNLGDNLGGSVTTSTSAPSGSDGDLWFNESTGQLFVYAGDGWVEVNGSDTSSSDSGSGFQGFAWSYNVGVNSVFSSGYSIGGPRDEGDTGHIVGANSDGNVEFGPNLNFEITHNLGTNRIGYAVRIELPGGSPRQRHDITGSGIWGSTYYGTRLIDAGGDFSNTATVRLMQRWLDWTECGPSLSPSVKSFTGGTSGHIYNIYFYFWTIS